MAAEPATPIGTVERVNFVGHIEVARLVGGGRSSSPGFLLGAALPDLAAMGRFRLTDRPADPDMAAGVDLHHRTDDAFHRHPLFRSTSSAASTALAEAGLSRGASRACGHVGIELLLDGHLLGDRAVLRSSVEEAMATGADRAGELIDLVGPEHRAEWHHHLERLTDWPVPDDYHRPDAVARRLQRILSRRPRLRFSADDVGAVATGLAGQAHAVITGAPGLLDDLDRDLTTPG